MSLLVIFELLGVFVNTLTADDKYYLRNSENLLLPIQMQLTKKWKKISQLFRAFLKFASNFQYFQTKDDPSSIIYSENYRLPKMWLEKYLKSLISEHPSNVSMLKRPNILCYLQESAFIVVFHYSGRNLCGKCRS